MKKQENRVHYKDHSSENSRISRQTFNANTNILKDLKGRNIIMIEQISKLDGKMHN
jgi:hypothetical protein